jgi:hypothetical protein
MAEMPGQKQLGQPWAVKVAEVMGLDPSMLSGMTISAYRNEIVTVNVTHHLSTEQADKVLEIMTDYELVLRRTSLDRIDAEEADH